MPINTFPLRLDTDGISILMKRTDNFALPNWYKLEATDILQLSNSSIGSYTTLDKNGIIIMKTPGLSINMEKRFQSKFENTPNSPILPPIIACPDFEILF